MQGWLSSYSAPLDMFSPRKVSKVTTNILMITTLLGILLSGGDWADVEVVFPLTGQSCSLPSNFGYPTRSHTMDGLTICGGYVNHIYYNSTVCETFSSGEWLTSHTLVEERYAHCSWQTDQGVVLMGGGQSPYTSEIAPLGGGQSQPSFSMQHSTRLVLR